MIYLQCLISTLCCDVNCGLPLVGSGRCSLSVSDVLNPQPNPASPNMADRSDQSHEGSFLTPTS